MMQRIGIAIGAGLAAALLFALTAKDTMLAATLASLAPLPIVIAALGWGLVDVVAPEGGLDAAVDRVVAALLECGPEALRAQKALLREWEELPLKESVDLSIGVFGKSFLTDEPHRMMQGFIDRKR